MRKRSLRQREAGSIFIVLMFSLFGVAILCIAAAQLSDTASRISAIGTQKVEATELAEAGVQTLYDQLCSQMVLLGTYPTQLAPTTLYSTVNGVTRAMGTYSATAKVDTSLAVAVKDNNGTITGYVTTWNITLVGTGVAASAGTMHTTSSTVSAQFTANQIQAAANSSGSGMPAFGNGAVQANGKILMTTNGGLRIYQAGPGRNSADIIANAGIGWQPYNQSRANANPNVLDIQGKAAVPAAPDPAWSFTNDPTSGLYKSAGNGVFLSAAAQGVSANQVAALSAPATFPSTAQVALWQTQWSLDAKSTLSINLFSVNASSVAAYQANPGWGEHRITAPAYIGGDLNVDNGQLYLQPNSDSSKSNIIYVAGNVNNSALLYNRGVRLIIGGKYKETSQSAQYSLQMQYSPYNSGNVGNGSGQESVSSNWSKATTGWPALYESAALVTLAPAADSVTMYTSSSTAEGLIYAANGGMAIYGNNELDGALIAGGVGSLGNIAISPNNGNSFVVWYHDEAVNGRNNDFTIPVTGLGAITQVFAATKRLYNWVQIN